MTESAKDPNPAPPVANKNRSNWRETGRFGHAFERVQHLWKRGRPPQIEELMALRQLLQGLDPRFEAGPYLCRIDQMLLRHPRPRPYGWIVQRLGDRVALRTERREYLLTPDEAGRIGRELSGAAGPMEDPGERQRVLADVDERDAEATRRFAILDALASSYGSSIEDQVEAVLKALTREPTLWAFERLVCLACRSAVGPDEVGDGQA